MTRYRPWVPLGLSPAQTANWHRRGAMVALRHANEAADNPAPWALGNLRWHQNMYSEAYGARLRVLMAYIERRKART